MRVTYGQGFDMRPAETMRERVAKLETALLDVPQVDCPIRHHFAPGIYAREINIPAGTVLVGVDHKIDNLVIVSMGSLRIVTDDGTTVVKAGDTLLCKAGTKNAAVALEDTRWTNILPNPSDERDTARLAEMFTYVKESDLLGGSTNKQIVANKAALQGETPCRGEW